MRKCCLHTLSSYNYSSRFLLCEPNHLYLANGVVSDAHGWLCGFSVDHHVNVSKNQFQVVLALSDYEAISTIMNLLGMKSIISVSTNKDGSPKASLFVRSDELVEDLIRIMPCNPSKRKSTLSCPLKIVAPFGSKAIPGYVRGLSGADGTWGVELNLARLRWELGMHNEEFITGLQEVVYRECNIKGKMYKDKKRFRLMIYDSTDLVNFAKWMYDDFNLNLPMVRRKFDRAFMWTNTVKQNLVIDDRRKILKHLMQQDHYEKNRIHDQFIEWMHQNNAEFNFNQTFKDRIDLMTSKFRTINPAKRTAFE